MDAAAVARFISKTTGSTCYATEDPVINVIRKYDYDNDGALNLSEFL